MSFLNPWVLTALAAASIPILLHLLNRRSNNHIVVPTLRLIIGHEGGSQKVSVLLHRLQLALRICIIVLLVTAFAKPIVGGQDVERGPVLYVLDTSPSMRDSGDPEQTIEGLASILADDSEATIAVVDARGELLILDPELLSESVSDDRSGASFSDLPFRLPDLLEHLEIRSAEFSGWRRVCIVTDGQRLNFDALPPAVSRSERSLPVGLFILEDRTQFSGGIDRVDVTIAAPGQLELDVQIAAQSKGHRGHLAFRINGRIVHQTEEREIPVGARTIRTSLPLDPGGPNLGTVDLVVDDETCDREFFAVESRERRTIGVIGKSIDFDRVIAGLPLPPVVRETTINAAVRNQSHEAIIVLGLSAIGDQDAAAISTYLQSGGGVVLIARQDESWSDIPLSLLESFGLTLDVPSFAATRYARRISRIDVGHPLFHGVFDGGGGARVPDPTVSWVRGLSSGHPLVELDDGTSLLSVVEHPFGRIVYLATMPDANDELTTTGLIVPIVDRSINFARGRSRVVPSFRVGEPVSLAIAASGAVRLVAPDGDTTESEVRGGVLSYDGADRVGSYRLEAEGRLVGQFVANLDPRERDLSRATDEEIEAGLAYVVDTANLSIRRGGIEDVAEVFASRMRIWPIAGIVLLMLVCLEIALSRPGIAGKRRSTT